MSSLDPVGEVASQVAGAIAIVGDLNLEVAAVTPPVTPGVLELPEVSVLCVTSQNDGMETALSVKVLATIALADDSTLVKPELLASSVQVRDEGTLS